MKFDKTVSSIIESSINKKIKLIRPEDSSIGERKMFKLMENINQFLENILNLNDQIQKDIFDRIVEAKNKAEYQHRITWLSEGSLLYHTMHKEYGKMEHGGRRIERELYKKIVDHINQN